MRFGRGILVDRSGKPGFVRCWAMGRGFDIQSELPRAVGEGFRETGVNLARDARFTVRGRGSALRRRVQCRAAVRDAACIGRCTICGQVCKVCLSAAGRSRQRGGHFGLFSVLGAAVGHRIRLLLSGGSDSFGACSCCFRRPFGSFLAFGPHGKSGSGALVQRWGGRDR